MYIPSHEGHHNQVLVALPELDPSNLPVLNSNCQFGSLSLLGSRSTENATNSREGKSFDLPEAFVGVSVATIVLMIVIIA